MLSVLLRTIAISLLLSTHTAFSANDIASSPINYLISAQVKPNIFSWFQVRSATRFKDS